jgi:NAD(P)-dependent dehydrogenase (short-subunit alcohol dehydrogenase family)
MDAILRGRHRRVITRICRLIARFRQKYQASRPQLLCQAFEQGCDTVAREAGKFSISGGGVITLTQVMACELAPQNIRVNAIAPGPVETPLMQALQTEAMRAEWISEVPQRRYASPDEISGAAVFLLDGKKAGFVTGAICRGRISACQSKLAR